MDKLKMEARPMDEILKKVAAICPAAVQDNKIDFERLKQELEPQLDDSAESYNFTWVGKRDAIMGAATPIRKTLRPCREESKNWDTTKNLYIEGDNLDVLKLLQESYLGKVKMIYIDPPYNTGSDFVYCDDFADNCEEYLAKKGQCDVETHERLFKNDESNGRFHSNWCTMIYPRLKVARDLLADDGVIFISIDDHEQANLKKICDEIFGEGNFVSAFIWEKKKKPSFLNANLGTKSEYILCYARQRQTLGALSVDTTEVGKKYPINNAGNSINTLIFPANSVRFNMDDCVVKKSNMSEGNIITMLETDVIIKNGRNVNEFALKGEWRYSQAKLNEIIAAGDQIVISKVPFRPNHIKSGGEIKKIHNLLTMALYPQIGTNEDSTSELANLGFGNLFDYAKPTSLIDFLIKACTYNAPDSIILDFFSGSATTAHAVMQLNAEDGGKRKFIMVQLPEKCDEKSEAFKAGYKNICEIGKERIRRAGDKIVTETGKADLDIGFKVLKLDDSNMEDVYFTPATTAQTNLLQMVDNVKQGRTELDLLYGVMLDLGLQLDLAVAEVSSGKTTYYNVDNGSLIACFAQNIPESIIKEIANLKPLRVVFKDSSFADAPSKINVTEIFKTLSPNTKITVL